MTFELITESGVFQKVIGLIPEDSTLQSGIFREAPRDRLPILVRKEDGTYALLARRLEIGNYYGYGRGAQQMRDHKVQLVAYDPYFTMSENGSEYFVHKNEGFALRDGLKCSEAVAHKDMPYDRFTRIRECVSVKVADAYEETPFYAYEVDEAYVAERFSCICPEDVKLALDILKDRTHVNAQELAILERDMNAPRADQFALLRSMMKESSISQIWADTQMTIHTFTALDWDSIIADQMFACCNKKETLFFSAKPVEASFLKPIGQFSGYEEAAKFALSPGKVGIERKSIPVGRVLPIGEDRCVDAAAMLTLWRDRHAYQFLPYYVINANGNIYAMEEACKWAKQTVESGVHATERDMDRKYEEYLTEYSEKYKLGRMKLVKYFVVLHAGVRCPFPAVSSDYVLNKDMKTLKIDSGATLFKDGLLMSASDQCRCYNLTPEAQRVYEILAENMRTEVIPNIRGGMRGSEVYWHGLEPLCAFEQEFREIGMSDESISMHDDYNRNIGHTIDKEESCSVAADKRDERIFETNMLGCIEYQWPYKDFCIGVEDMFYIAPEGAINIVY